MPLTASLPLPCSAPGPVLQVFELPNKSDKIMNFAWEPKGHRFCIVHGEGQRPNVSFYTMRDDKGRQGVKLLSECRQH